MTSDDLYKNPFADYNANKMDSRTILEYWCNPFTSSKSKAAPSGSFSENDVLSNEMPIVFVGGRGTGKTMFFKYFSYPVQLEQAKRDLSGKRISSFSEYFSQKGSIGLYIRIDGPLLRSFSGKALEQDQWDAIFTHYFELRVCQAVLEIVSDLVNQEIIPLSGITKHFLAEAGGLLQLKKAQQASLEAINHVVNADIQDVTNFRSDIVFNNVKFVPRKAFATGDLFGIVKAARKVMKSSVGDVMFAMFIDEYENFSEFQQRQINTLLKFVPDGVSFRIGMRSEGFHTHETVSKNEFIKRGRDYQEITFEEVLIKDKDYEGFLLRVAEKRLEAVPVFKRGRYTDIRKLLGTRADLEEEAKQLISHRKTPDQHFKLLRFAKNCSSIDKAKKVLAHANNPLLEMLNILWVIRGWDPDEVGKIMNDYLKGKKSKEVEKYRMDYVDKYKLSLMFLLCSIYRQNKRYYSFNTFCFLSSGIVGNFIELCRRSFQLAYFEDREALINQGTISPVIQDAAAKETSLSELQMVTRIYQHGEVLHRFLSNLGNIFRSYQIDVRMKYPETNQFAIDAEAIHDDALKSAFHSAIEWSLIQKKPKLQRTSPNSQRRVIYTLNRIFSPAFEITYRTRGQFSEEYSVDDLRALMHKEGIQPKIKLLSDDTVVDGQQQQLI